MIKGATSKQLMPLFISEDLQVRLKRLGFAETCLAIRAADNKLFVGAYHHEHVYYEHAMILYQQAVNWLRVSHKIWVEANVNCIGLNINYKTAIVGEFPIEYIFNDNFDNPAEHKQALDLAIEVAIKKLEDNVTNK